MPRTSKNSSSPAVFEKPAEAESPPARPRTEPKKTGAGAGRKKKAPSVTIIENETVEVVVLPPEPPLGPPLPLPSVVAVPPESTPEAPPPNPPKPAPKLDFEIAGEELKLLTQRMETARRIASESEQFVMQLRKELTGLRELTQANLTEIKSAQELFHGFRQELAEMRKASQEQLTEMRKSSQAHFTEIRASGEQTYALHQDLTEARKSAQAGLSEIKASLERVQGFRTEFDEVRRLAQANSAELAASQEQFRGLADKATEATRQVDELRAHLQQSIDEMVGMREEAARLKNEVQQPMREMNERLPETGKAIEAIRNELNAMNEEVQTTREEMGRVGEASRQLLTMAELEPFQDHLRELRLQLPETERQVQEIQTELGRVGEDLRETGAEVRRVKDRTKEIPVAFEAEAPIRHHNRLGLTVESGVLVAEVLHDTPAEQAGLVQGDFIEAVNGRAVQSAVHFREIVGAFKEGESLTITSFHAGVERSVAIQLGSSAPTEPAGEEHRSRLGVTVDSCAIVAEVLPDSPAAVAGVEIGDVILAVDGTAIMNAAELREAVLQHAPQARLILSFIRQGERREITLLLTD